MSTKIFIGPTYYQRLKHMVKDKINSRAGGKVSLKTKQPPSGRALGGGLRIGEMERDSILAHGASQFLKETMYDRSDSYSAHISNYSGLGAITNISENRFVCPSLSGPLVFDEDNLALKSNNTNICDIVKVNVPYNTNVLINECQTMGLSLRLLTEEPPKYEKIN